MGNKQPTSTKRGPGRFHQPGHKKASPVKTKGTPRGFVQHTNPKRHQRRALFIKTHGVRQWKRLQRGSRAIANLLGA